MKQTINPLSLTAHYVVSFGRKEFPNEFCQSNYQVKLNLFRELQLIGRSAKRDKLGTSSSTVTNFSVFDGFVSHRILGKVLTNHVSFNFNWSPISSRVNFCNTTNHFWHDNGVTEVSLDCLWLITVRSVFDGSLDLLQKSIVLGVDSTIASSALSRLEESNYLVVVHFEQLVDFNTSVNLFLEWLSLGGLTSCVNLF